MQFLQHTLILRRACVGAGLAVQVCGQERDTGRDKEFHSNHLGRLLRCAVLVARIRDSGDQPLAADVHEVEEIGSAMVRLAIDQEHKGRPNHGEVVIDPNQRLVNAFLDATMAGFGDMIGERFDRHLLRLAFPHQYEHCAWQGRGLDGIGVSMRHPGKQCIDGGEDGGVLRVHLRRGKQESQCDGSRNESRGFHGA